VRAIRRNGKQACKSMKVTVEHSGSVQFEISARGHRIVNDQPVAAGGFDEGMTPPELLLASLGACAGYFTPLSI
jgi:putative redox protein